jgi:AmmeMemoRadiSam system protein B
MTKMVHSVTDVRPSPLAGRWYPAQAESLREMVERFLAAAPTTNLESGKVVGLLAPHAGLRFSGPVGAHAFALIRNLSFDTVVVIGPMHHPIPGEVHTTAHLAYETPLGTIPVDQETLTTIGKTIPLTPLRNDPEHSVEIELPFLQHVLTPGFMLVPLMLREQSAMQSEMLGSALADALADRKVLFVASSDLSHFYPQKVANELDSTMLSAIEAMDAKRVVNLNERGLAFACGYGAIATVIHAVTAWEVNQARITGYATSGDVTGDFNQVVGYGAGAFYQAS